MKDVLTAKVMVDAAIACATNARSMIVEVCSFDDELRRGVGDDLSAALDSLQGALDVLNEYLHPYVATGKNPTQA